MSRSVSVENPERYSLPSGCCGTGPASSFSPHLAGIFQFSDICRELSLGFPFLLREKKRKGFFHGLLSAGLYIAPRGSLYSASECGVIPSLPRVQRGTEGYRGVQRLPVPLGAGIKKEPEGCLLSTSFRLYLLRWRLPTLPLAQYHRRDGA